MLTLENISKLVKGSIPQNKEELDWINNYNKSIKKAQKESEDYLNKKNLCKKEKKELLDLYLPTEYLENGYFNSKEFKEIESKIELTLDVYFFLNGTMDYGLIHGVRLYLKEEILKEKYNIIWKDISYILPKSIKDKCREIEKKYGVH